MDEEKSSKPKWECPKCGKDISGAETEIFPVTRTFHGHKLVRIFAICPKCNAKIKVHP